MDKQQLDKRLRELHGELKNIESVDEEERQILEQLMTDIQEIFEQKEHSVKNIHTRGLTKDLNMP